VRDDAPFRDDEAAVRLVRDLHLRGEAIGWESLPDLGSCEDLMGDVVLGARLEDAVEDVLAALDDAGDVQELLARLRLELAPELVGAPE
jgi:hypothetical protein